MTSSVQREHHWVTEPLRQNRAIRFALFAVGLGPTSPHVPAGQPFSGAAPLIYQMQLLDQTAFT